MKQPSGFVHLHNHTEYSFLDGAIRIKDLVKRASEFGMPALAITDHGGMFGCVEFYAACMKEGIKPILGFEAYVAPQSRLDKVKSADEDAYSHLILLARTQEGYRNLMRLSTIGYLEGFYYKPRIDMEVIRKHSAGIIATSACVAGAIPRLLLAEKREKAKSLAAEMQGIFGEGNFYFELQDHGIAEERTAMTRLIELGTEMGIPFIVANDAHYLNKEDAASHEILLCIQTQTTIDDPKRFRFGSDQVYFKSPEEMAALFPNVPDALANTVTIAERCGATPIEPKKQIAHPGCPTDFDSEGAYLTHLAKHGMREKYAHVTPGLEERLEFELGVITKMGFDGYFLAVRDFVHAAKQMGVMTGCRGSAAGSLVAFALGITDVDPIRFELLFERFLNPERVSLPDADIDFADRDREKVIEYVIRKYGKDNVCQIINFGRMKAKMVVKDVARAMGFAPADAQKLANMVTEKDLKASIESNGELARLLQADQRIDELFRHARVLEGLARQAGMHAAGVVIAPQPVVNWAPLFKQPGEDSPVMTQYDMKYVEDAGLIKMDFLGLITLTILQDTVRLVQQNHGVHIDLWKLPDRDAKTYALLGRGETVAVFQFESQGMQDNLRKLQPDNIEDLIAMCALYRPGPMDEIPTYIHRKHGKERVDYSHPLLEDILKGTYGVIVYQEQVMRTSRVMGGFSMGQADNLRKAMSKKKMDEIDKMREMFVAGSEKHGVPAKVAQDIYARMAKFGEYGFNKAHSAVYAHVAYQCAYLKANYAIEFMTANLSSAIGKQDDLLIVRNEAERMGMKILPPDVTHSEIECSIEDGMIRLGLGAIKNVGKGAESIIQARKRKGTFASIFDMFTAVDLRLVNKKALESLIYAGALDSLQGTRAQQYAAIDRAIEYGSSFQEERLSGQTSLFGGLDDAGAAVSIPEPALPDVPPWPYAELLAHEKEILNFYVSGHPLEKYRDEVLGFATLKLGSETLANVKAGQKVTVGGIIESLRPHTQKDGRQMAFGVLEDFEGSIELVVFSDAFEKVRHHLAPDVMVLVHGSIDIRDGEGKPKLLVDNVLPLSEARERLTKSVHIRVRTQGLEATFLDDITRACRESVGECALVVHLVTHENNDFRILSRQYRVNAARETITHFRERLGETNVWLSRTAA